MKTLLTFFLLASSAIASDLATVRPVVVVSKTTDAFVAGDVVVYGGDESTQSPGLLLEVFTNNQQVIVKARRTLRDLATIKKIDTTKYVLTGPPGEYMIEVLTFGEAGLESFDAIGVIGKPEPKPDPEPGPDPQPEPTGFEASVKAAVALVSNKSGADAIAGVYSSVASEAESAKTPPADMVSDVKSMLSTVLTLEQMAAWQPFWPAMQKAFSALELDSNDTEGHVKAFQTVAKVLEGK